MIKRSFSLILSSMLIMSPVLVSGSTDGKLKNKHTIGFNVLRITDVDYLDFGYSRFDAGITTASGLTYQYTMSPLLALRASVSFDTKQFSFDRFDDNTSNYSSRTIAVGLQLPIIAKHRSSSYVFFDAYHKIGSGATYFRGFRRTLPPNTFTTGNPNRIGYSSSYNFMEFGTLAGLGKTIRLSEHISVNLETSIMFGEVKTSSDSNTSIVSTTSFNPLSRFSINYTL